MVTIKDKFNLRERLVLLLALSLTIYLITVITPSDKTSWDIEAKSKSNESVRK